MASTLPVLARRFRWITSHQTFEAVPLLQRRVTSLRETSSIRPRLKRVPDRICQDLETHPTCLRDTTQRALQPLEVDLASHISELLKHIVTLERGREVLAHPSRQVCRPAEETMLDTPDSHIRPSQVKDQRVH